MKAFLAQINPIVGDLRTNFEKHVDIINIVNSKKDSNPKLIIFPELSLIGYPARDLLFKKALRTLPCKFRYLSRWSKF
jgi:NAD+ synthase (glutamine-hydrolysing)